MENLFTYNDDLIRVTEYNVLGYLPDPFMKPDGTRITSPEEWPALRAEHMKNAVDLQYGTMPPVPEVFRQEVTCYPAKSRDYRITAGTKDRQVTFMMKVFLPDKFNAAVPVPAVVDGDGCWEYFMQPEFISQFTSRGIAFCLFDRTSLADDVQHVGRRHGPLYEVYPEYGFGAVGAWAWGFSRCVDALEQLDYIDKSMIAFTGHSRGAKTAFLAGMLDTRAAIVNPNETNALGCSCYRVHMKALTEAGNEARSETLKDMWGNFDFWVGEGMEQYTEHEELLPFDAHICKAMVAPRVLLVGEAASDIWTNPIGSWQTSCAAREVYKFLGIEDRMLWYFRRGFHSHTPQDACVLAQVIRHCKYGEPLPDVFYRTPFKQPEKIWNWKIPGEN